MRTVAKPFRAKRVVVDGYKFDSNAEAKRYGELKLLAMAGEIRDLEVHPALYMTINGRKIGQGYITLDFSYWGKAESGDWRLVYEDVKAVDSRESKVRREVCEAIHGIKIEVIGA